jgi:hypothetical protein
MNFSPANLRIAHAYYTGNTHEFDCKDADYQNLLHVYATDNNSSSIREAATLYHLGYTQLHDKHGADGYNEQTGRYIEVKPKLVKQDQRLGNCGNFNDMTHELLQKKMDMDVVVSLFSPSRMLLVAQFPFSTIYSVLLAPIQNAKLGRRVVCNFNLSHFLYNSDTRIHWCDLDELNKLQCLPTKHLNTLRLLQLDDSTRLS